MFTMKISSFYEYKIKGSIFISHIFKVSNLNIFKDKLSEMKVKYSDSTHICYGYRILGENTNLFNDPDIIEYYNDDGEPSGTSGKQILNSLKRKDIINCVIFIIRYYGGTKLGIPGLIDAYKLGSVNIIDKITLKQFVVTKIISITFNYEYKKIVDSIIKKYKCKILDNNFSEIIKIDLETSLNDYNCIKKELIEKTKGTIQFNK